MHLIRFIKAFSIGVLLIGIAFSVASGQGFVENAGQWDAPFYLKSSGNAAQVFIEKNALTFHMWDGEAYADFLEAAHDRKPYTGSTELSNHAYKMQFLGASKNSFIEKLHPSVHYYNYFLGADSSRWKTGVKEYETVIIRDVYPHIDVKIKKQDKNLKYDLIVKPGADHQKIRWSYEGILSVKIKDNQLELETSLGKVMELKPYAYQEYPDGKKEVECKYTLKKGQVGFEFPSGYDKKTELVIDPVLIFSTFTGATSDNWGFTATYDNDGNGYAGGITFGLGYPVSMGAFQTGFGGGNLDITISKFNANGSALLFSTFLGGNAPDMPHSMVVNSQDELIVMGHTGATNFPVTAGTYDATFNGGNPISFWTGLADYTNGTDIFVSKFNPTGTVLLGSTYLGGSGNDGLNLGLNLKFNYSDEFRGEVIVDDQDNIFVVSSTQSTNFPTVLPFQPAFGGGSTDACVLKLTPNLNVLSFSSYFGGVNDDSGYGIQINSVGQAYFCGGTMSGNLPVTPGVVKPIYGGGVDGYLVRLNQVGNTIAACTYIGTPDYNQTYFVQLDEFDNVYVTGQSIGGYPIQAGPTGTVYSNPNTGQFIHKMNSALTTTIMSTSFGANIGTTFNLVPSAFLVDVCNYIYIAGWGGTVNTSGGNTQGLPVTPNAYQTNSNGSDFYLIVFRENAEGIHYATYFGGVPAEHVDGGTSRFDKDGIVYQAICAGCGGNSLVPTTPGVYSNTNGSTNCNLALIKFDVSDYTAIIAPDVPPQVCVNTTVNFTNLSTGGTEFLWLFGDGTSSSSFNAQHTYTAPGEYTVMLVATQEAACIPSDTAFAQITIVPPPEVSVNSVSTICPGDSVQLEATGGNSYQWLPSTGLPANEANLPNPTVSPTSTTSYTVIAFGQCGSDTTQITVPVVNFSIQVSPNDTICLGSSKQLTASGGLNYQWSPATGLNNPDIANPLATPDQTTLYTVTVTSPEGCVLSDSVRIQVDEFPVTDAGPDRLICLGESTQLQATGGNFFSWNPPVGLNNPSISNPVASPVVNTQYVVVGSNSCGFSSDTILINVQQVFPVAGPDTVLCPGTQVQLFAFGGATYRWTPSAYLNNPNVQFPVSTPLSNITYTVEVTDSIGCVATETVSVTMFPIQYPSAGPDLLIEFGQSETLTATGGNGNYTWSPPDFLSCTDCPNPTVTPTQTTGYQLTLTDDNNCSFYDTVTVFVTGDLWVPNVFTPGDVNGLNDLFLSLGRDIATVEMMIFNRWGELLFSTQDKNDGWNGTYKGKLCPLGVYVWKIRYTETNGREGNLLGHVTLLR